jgi:hypothetical protein
MVNVRSFQPFLNVREDSQQGYGLGFNTELRESQSQKILPCANAAVRHP